MGILSNVKTKIGYFILDHLVTQDVIQRWKSTYIEDLADIVPTQVIPATSPAPREQNTDAIDESAVNAAIKAQIVRGRALDVPADKLAPGKLAPWYWNRLSRITNEDTVELSAIRLQEKLRRILDGEGQG